MLKTLATGLLTLLLAGAAVWLMLIAWLWFRQESLLFFPAPLAADHRLANAPDVHELAIDVPGAKLSVLHLRLAQPRGMLFFLHGNAGNLASWFDESDAELCRQAGFDLVMMDYRGYGKSTGHIENEAQLRADVRAVWDQVAPRYADKPVVLYGRSLGTALAADLGARLSAEGRPPELTVLVSPYTSMRALGAEFYPWVPSSLLRYPLDTATHLLGVRGPILLLHGEQDTLTRVHHSQQLQRIVPGARLQVVRGAGHNDIQAFPTYRQTLLQALGQL
jgi:pimeloyl-ACP methyl ester carboxylesterase